MRLPGGAGTAALPSVWNELSISVVRDASGEMTHFVGFQRDVTRRVEAEHKLSEQRDRLQRYETVVENTTDAVVIKDSEGQYRLVNEQRATR